MPKSRYLPRMTNTREPTIPFSGALLLPRSTPAGRLNVTELSAIAVHAGELESGTIIAGDPHGAHMLIGTRAYGIQGYNTSGTLFFSVAWKNEALRIGRLGRPGITMAWGDVQIDGKCVISGSLEVDSINVGQFGRLILRDGVLFAGTGYPDNMTGIKVTADLLASYKDNQVVWQVDDFGNIATYGNDAAHQYVKLGSGGFEIGCLNDESMPGEAALKFNRYYPDPYNSELVTLTRQVAIDVNEKGFVFRNVVPSAQTDDYYRIPEISLRDDWWTEYVRIGRATFQLWDDTHSHSMAINMGSMDGETGHMWFSTTGNLQIIAGEGMNYTFMYANKTTIGMPLMLATSAPAEADREEGMLWWDSTAHKLYLWDGTNIQSADMTVVA